MPHLVHKPDWSVVVILTIKDSLCSSSSPKQDVSRPLSSHCLLQPT